MTTISKKSTYKKLYIAIAIPFLLNGQNLQELVNSSLENKLIKSTNYNIGALKSQYSSVQKSYLPKINISGSYTNTSKETAAIAKSSITSSANIDYILYDGGKKYSTYESFESSIKSANENLISLKNQISLQVVSYYFTYQSLISQKEAKQKEINTLNAQKIRLQKFLEAGTTTIDEIDKIISRIENETVAIHEIELNIQTILHNLEYLTTKNVKIDNGSTIKDIISMDETLRADIKAIELDMKKTLADAKSSKSNNNPTLTLNNSYNVYDMNYNNNAYDNGVNSQNVFKVNLSWNIFDFDSTTKAYESKYKEYKALKEKYEYEKNKASIDLKLAFKSYKIAKLKILSAQAGLKAANSTYKTIEAKYQNGLVENIAYLEALSEKYGAMSALKSAQFDLEIKKANIIYHSGKNIWEYIK